MDNREIMAFCRQNNINPAQLDSLIDILGPERALKVIKQGLHATRKLDAAGVAYMSQKDYSNDGMALMLYKVFGIIG